MKEDEIDFALVRSKVLAREGGRDNRLPPEINKAEFQAILDHARSGKKVSRALLRAVAWYLVMHGSEFELWSTEMIDELIDDETDTLEEQIEAGLEARRQLKILMKKKLTKEAEESVRLAAEEAIIDRVAYHGRPVTMKKIMKQAERESHHLDPELCPLIKPLSVRPRDNSTDKAIRGMERERLYMERPIRHIGKTRPVFRWLSAREFGPPDVKVKVAIEEGKPVVELVRKGEHDE